MWPSVLQQAWLAVLEQLRAVAAQRQLALLGLEVPGRLPFGDRWADDHLLALEVIPAIGWVEKVPAGRRAPPPNLLPAPPGRHLAPQLLAVQPPTLPHREVAVLE